VNVSIYQAKSKFSELIQAVESGEEVVVSRRKKPVARLLPVTRAKTTRVGSLADRPYHMGEDFDDPVAGSAIANAFGVPEK